MCRKEYYLVGGAVFNESIARALVLNASYEPLKIVGWQKAIILWFQGKVDILDHHNLFVRSVQLSFQVPSIIRLKTYVNVRKTSPIRFSRENIYVRDKYICQYCCARFSTKDLTLDHVMPVSKGGKKDWNNIVTACKACNQVKADRTPYEAKMPLKTKPVAPQWLPQEELRISTNNAPDSWLIYLQFEIG